jgi:hypothetical protein
MLAASPSERKSSEILTPAGMSLPYRRAALMSATITSRFEPPPIPGHGWLKTAASIASKAAKVLVVTELVVPGRWRTADWATPCTSRSPSS